MIGIYLLVTIFSQFAAVTQMMPVPSIPAGQFASVGWLGSQEQSPVALEVVFDSLPSVKTGSPVVLNGHKIGTVEKVAATAASNKDSSYSVSLKLSPSSLFEISSKTVALQATPMTAARSSKETVVELVSLPGTDGLAVKSGETLLGYSSIEAFWTAGKSGRS